MRQPLRSGGRRWIGLGLSALISLSGCDTSSPPAGGPPDVFTGRDDDRVVGQPLRPPPGTYRLTPQALAPTVAVNPLVIPPGAVPTGINAYTLEMRESLHDFGLTGGLKTRVWGYSDGRYTGYLGPTIHATTGVPLSVTWVNTLPGVFPFAQDPLPQNPGPPHWAETGVGSAVAHLHGGHTDALSDGTPHQHFAPGQSRTFTYRNDQPSAGLWYHDHALGFTRLNVYAGLAGMYLLHDAAEQALNIPRGPYEVPLVLQDKSFNADGSLFYPPSWAPEFFGDVPIVNGRAFPFLAVEPRRYRLRIVNGATARFFRLSLTEPALGRVRLHQIGSDGGLLPEADSLGNLLLGPGERADVIVNFAGMAGRTLTLTNSAGTPFTGRPDPNGGVPPLPKLMEFRVTTPVSGKDTSVVPGRPRPLTEKLRPALASVRRDLTLNEALDPLTGAPIRSLLGTLNPDGSPNLRAFADPLTESVKLGAVEVWNVINNTVDVHPIHLHLVQFQVLDRRPVRRNAAGHVIGYGAPFQPDLNERGWKDTVRMNPNEATRIIARFDLAGDFVWHCHILEHEENDMMRPFTVAP